MARIEIDSDWEVHVDSSVATYFTDELGPKIAGDAKRCCPKNTGALANSIEDHLEGPNLIVSATGDGVRHYAAFVELGHRIYHPSTRTSGPDVVPPQPFLRPALYGAGCDTAASRTRDLYRIASEQSRHLGAGYREAPHAQPHHLVPQGYEEERIAVNMAAALLHESPSRKVALREAVSYAHRTRSSYGPQHQLTRRAERAITYLRRITRSYGG
jgi:hypothetical protein